MIPYQYTYLVGDLILLCIWLILFLWRKDVREEMLVISSIFGVVALSIAPYYISDWWKPLTITGTPIGIEDFLFGFGIAGVVAVIYEEIFKKRVRVRKPTKTKRQERKINLLSVLTLMAALFLASFYLLNLNTFVASVGAFSIPIIIIWVRRKDLIIDSLVTGFIVVFMMVVSYSILRIISPGFIEEFWIFENIGKIMVLGIPLEEIIWFFLAGALIGPLYEYWKEGKLVNKK